MHLAYITSMPSLSCSNCYMQREELERLKHEVTGVRRDLKATKKALEASQKMEKALRERYGMTFTLITVLGNVRCCLNSRFIGLRLPSLALQEYVGGFISHSRINKLLI